VTPSENTTQHERRFIASSQKKYPTQNIPKKKKKCLIHGRCQNGGLFVGKAGQGGKNTAGEFGQEMTSMKCARGNQKLKKVRVHLLEEKWFVTRCPFATTEEGNLRRN